MSELLNGTLKEINLYKYGIITTYFQKTTGYFIQSDWDYRRSNTLLYFFSENHSESEAATVTIKYCWRTTRMTRPCMNVFPIMIFSKWQTTTDILKKIYHTSLNVSYVIKNCWIYYFFGLCDPAKLSVSTSPQITP